MGARKAKITADSAVSPPGRRPFGGWSVCVGPVALAPPAGGVPAPLGPLLWGSGWPVRDTSGINAVPVSPNSLISLRLAFSIMHIKRTTWLPGRAHVRGTVGYQSTAFLVPLCRAWTHPRAFSVHSPCIQAPRYPCTTGTCGTITHALHPIASSPSTACPASPRAGHASSEL